MNGKKIMKKIYPLLIALFVVFTACDSGDNDGKEEVINLSLSNTEVKLNMRGSDDIEVIGVDIDKCTIYSEDEFIAYAMEKNGKINIEAEHAGETNVIIKYEELEAVCKVKVIPSEDFIGSAVTDFGISEEELKSKVEEPYDRYFKNPQTKATEVYYTRSGYKIVDSYYFDESGLVGVKKAITSTDSDMNTMLNIKDSMRERMRFLSSSTKTINSYPKATQSNYICTHDKKYHAVYEQIKYEILYETGKRPATVNRIFFAKDLEEAKQHHFAN